MFAVAVGVECFRRSLHVAKVSAGGPGQAGVGAVGPESSRAPAVLPASAGPANAATPIVRSEGIRRDDNGRWEAPGGVLELDESVEDAVRREVLEETGLKVTVQRLAGVYKNLTDGIVALVYRCRPTVGITDPTAEAREVRWMTKDEVQSAINPAAALSAAAARWQAMPGLFGFRRQIGLVLVSAPVRRPGR